MARLGLGLSLARATARLGSNEYGSLDPDPAHRNKRGERRESHHGSAAGIWRRGGRSSVMEAPRRSRGSPEAARPLGGSPRRAEPDGDHSASGGSSRRWRGVVSARCGSGELGVTRRRRFPAVSKGEMVSGNAQQQGEKREQERRGGGARRRSEIGGEPPRVAPTSANDFRGRAA